MYIEVDHITKVYGKQKALDDVSFTVRTGEIVGLLGPNGAGKSTMMKIITCFITPTEGNVTVDGFGIFEHPLEIKRRVGYLPENNPLYSDLYIREYLEFVAGIHRLKMNIRDRVEEIIHLTGLSPEQNKKIGALSKGFRQRVGLAQALIHDPAVLILDEPTSGLDPNQLLEIRNLIREIGKDKTIILSTHIMQEVEAVCNRAIIIDKGRIAADDTTGKLSGLFSSGNILRVEFSHDIKPSVFKEIIEISHIRRLDGNAWEIRTSGQADIREEIFRLAVKYNLAVLSLHKVEKSLEEVFQQITSDPVRKSEVKDSD